VACSLALLASGQAIAAGTCTSASSGFLAWNDPDSWLDGTAGGASCDGSTGSTAPANGDSAVIDGPVIVGVAVTINNLTVNAGKTLSFTGNLTVDGTATINGGITYMSGTLSPKITSIGGLFTATLSAAGYTLPSTVTSLGGGVSVSGGALTLAAANVVTGDVTITGGGIAGVLKLAPTGNHTITALSTGSIIPSLDLSGATANKVITSSTGDLTFTAVTFPTAGSKVITFTAAAANTISVPVPAATVATCMNDGVAATASSTATVAATKSLVCTSVGSSSGGGAVSAPIDLHFSKQVETYSTDIELK